MLFFTYRNEKSGGPFLPYISNTLECALH